MRMGRRLVSSTELSLLFLVHLDVHKLTLIASLTAEVGFDPTTGEWYYRTMRPDKVAPNHISTVLGTLLELAESLSTEELRYRMSVPSGTRDTYTKDVRNMQKQLLDHQRRKNKASGSR